MTEKVAVITGSGDGLGKGIAQRLAQDGFRIVLSDINAATLEKTEAEFKTSSRWCSTPCRLSGASTCS